MKKYHLPELLACVVVFLAVVLAAFSFREWKKREDCKRCIINLRNVQQAFRGHLSCNQGKTYAEFGPEIMQRDLFTGPDRFLDMPKCPSGGTYTFHDYKVINPRLGFIFCTCSHADTLGHKPDNTDDW